MDDLGADSLDIVELVMAIEEEFDLEIPDEGELPLRPSNFIVGLERMPVVFPPRAPRGVAA